MEHSRSREANSLSYTVEINCLLWTPSIHDRGHKRQPLSITRTLKYRTLHKHKNISEVEVAYCKQLHISWDLKDARNMNPNFKTDSKGGTVRIVIKWSSEK